MNSKLYYELKQELNMINSNVKTEGFLQNFLGKKLSQNNTKESQIEIFKLIYDETKNHEMNGLNNFCYENIMRNYKINGKIAPVVILNDGDDFDIILTISRKEDLINIYKILEAEKLRFKILNQQTSNIIEKRMLDVSNVYYKLENKTIPTRFGKTFSNNLNTTKDYDKNKVGNGRKL